MKNEPIEKAEKVYGLLLVIHKSKGNDINLVTKIIRERVMAQSGRTGGSLMETGGNNYHLVGEKKNQGFLNKFVYKPEGVGKDEIVLATYTTGDIVETLIP